MGDLARVVLITIARMDAETGTVRFAVSEAMEHFFPTWVVSRDGAVTVTGTRQVATLYGDRGSRTRAVPLADRHIPFRTRPVRRTRLACVRAVHASHRR